jgi:hypothetical protein
MTTVRSVHPVAAPADAAGGGPGERLRRLCRRQRLVREELLTIVVLLVALAATLVVLGLQWLDSGQSASSGAVSVAARNISGGHT